MRNFQELNVVEIDAQNGIIYISCSDETDMHPRLAMRREGSYLAISCSYGPLEIAMRPRYAEVTRMMGRLRPVQGLQTTRQVGTGQAYLALGLQEDGDLVIRPTIVADATGHVVFNLLLIPSVREELFKWLPVDENPASV